MKKTLVMTGVILGLLSINPAYAHGDAKPKHGGVVKMADDLTFELVNGGDCAIIHIEDHGKPLAAKGMSGKLTLLKGAHKTDFSLSIEGNTLKAKGAQFEKGDKLVATIVTAQQKTVTVRFHVK